MGEKSVSVFTKIHTTVAFIVMVTVNVLANLIPLNGVNTGQVSDKYPNLFAPAGITFSIWSVIYILLAGYILYQFGIFQRKSSAFSKEYMEKIGVLFTLSSIANTAWVFVWHYDAIGISVMLIIAMLIFLILINERLKDGEFSIKEKIFIRLPFSIYFGWITIAVIANITTYLVSIGWNGFGIPESIWTIVILITGLLIGGFVTYKNWDVAYGFVIIWAYIGILIKHLSPEPKGFEGRYPFIVTILIVCIVLLLIEVVYVLFARKEKLTRIFSKK